MWRVLVLQSFFPEQLWSDGDFFFVDLIVEVADELEGFHDLRQGFVFEDAAEAGGLELVVGDGDVDAVPAFDLLGHFFVQSDSI